MLRRAVSCAGVIGLLGLLGLPACSSDGSAPDLLADVTTASPESGETAPSTVTADRIALATDIEPWVPEGWEIQRAYRQPATFLDSDVELVAVYLRPIGADPTPAEYLEQAVVALQSIASEVFASDASVTAIDVCLQHANDAGPDVEVKPAVQMLGVREDLDPLLAAGVQLVDLTSLSRNRKLVLFVDEYVKQAPAWNEAIIASAATTIP